MLVFLQKPLASLQPRNIFLTDIGDIPLKFNHQENSTPLSLCEVDGSLISMAAN